MVQLPPTYLAKYHQVSGMELIYNSVDLISASDPSCCFWTLPREKNRNFPFLKGPAMFLEEISKVRIKTFSLIFLSKFPPVLSPCRQNVCIMTVRFLNKHRGFLGVLVIQCAIFLSSVNREEYCSLKIVHFILQPALQAENNFRFCTVKYHHWNFAETQTVFHWMIIPLNVLSLVYAACII